MLGQMLRRSKKPLTPPSFIAGSSKNNWNGSSLDTFINVPKPAAAVGDLLLAFIVVQNDSTVITAPSGWAIADTGNNEGKLYSKLLAAGDPSTYQWSIAATAWLACGMVAYRNAVIDVHASVIQGTFPYHGDIAPSVTTTLPNEIAVHFWGFFEGNSTNALQGITQPAGTTQRVKMTTPGSTPSGIPITVADEAVASPSVVPTRTATLDDGAVTGNWQATPITVGLKGL